MLFGTHLLLFNMFEKLDNTFFVVEPPRTPHCIFLSQPSSPPRKHPALNGIKPSIFVHLKNQSKARNQTFRQKFKSVKEQKRKIEYEKKEKPPDMSS